MSNFRLNITMTLDGYVAGPNQSVENPLGEGGERMHEWLFNLKTFREIQGYPGDGESGTNDDVLREAFQNVGTTIMGRNMFGGGPSEEDPANGQAMPGRAGGETTRPTTRRSSCSPTTPASRSGCKAARLSSSSPTAFTDGIESALEKAKEAARGKDVVLGGGASVAQQYLAAGLLDEVQINLVPMLLGGGERLLDNLPVSKVRLEPVRTIAGPGVTHLKYRLVK